jgi:hypothetical protein
MRKIKSFDIDKPKLSLKSMLGTSKGDIGG